MLNSMSPLFTLFFFVGGGGGGVGVVVGLVCLFKLNNTHKLYVSCNVTVQYQQYHTT